MKFNGDPLANAAGEFLDCIEQAKVEQVKGHGIKHFAAALEKVGRFLQMLANGFLGTAEGRDRFLHFAPNVGRRQEVFVFHRLEQGIDHQIAEADGQEQRRLFARQVDQAGNPFVSFRIRLVGVPSLQSAFQIAESNFTVGHRAESQRTGIADALVPIIGQDQRRTFGYGVNRAGDRLLVVVRRSDLRRPRGPLEQRRVPEGRVAVEEGTGLFVGQGQRILGRQLIRT